MAEPARTYSAAAYERPTLYAVKGSLEIPQRHHQEQVSRHYVSRMKEAIYQNRAPSVTPINDSYTNTMKIALYEGAYNKVLKNMIYEGYTPKPAATLWSRVKTFFRR